MMDEAEVQKLLRLEASRRGWRLWRNNRGVAYDNRGVPVRFGLANDSMSVNNNLKSSDLIGIAPIIITPEHIGRKIGVFTSIECKKPNWKYTGSKNETAQRNWIDLVNMLGGYAKFVSSLEDL
jgi:hypothetical protein